MGFDVAVTVVDTLKRDLGWELADPPDWLRRKVHDGQLGRKTGQEFYIRTDGKAVKAKDVDAPDPGVANRLILPMLNTFETHLRECVATDEDVIDAALIFGFGFAPFRGGPLHFVHAFGPAKIRGRLASLAGSHGERFTSDPAWDAMAAKAG